MSVSSEAASNHSRICYLWARRGGENATAKTFYVAMLGMVAHSTQKAKAN